MGQKPGKKLEEKGEQKPPQKSINLRASDNETRFITEGTKGSIFSNFDIKNPISCETYPSDKNLPIGPLASPSFNNIYPSPGCP